MYDSFVSRLPIIFLNLNFIMIKTKTNFMKDILNDLCQMIWFSPASSEKLCEKNSSVDMIQSALHDIILSFCILMIGHAGFRNCNVHFVKF